MLLHDLRQHVCNHAEHLKKRSQASAHLLAMTYEDELCDFIEGCIILFMVQGTACKTSANP